MPAHLIAEEGALSGLILNLEPGEEWVVGRGPEDVDFVLEDSKISKKHARISRGPDGLFIQNLSRNYPTLVNGTPIKERTLIQENDRIQIGDTVFRFTNEAISEEGISPKPKKEKKKGGYEDIFGELETPELPPEPEPVEEITEEKISEHEETPIPTVPEPEKEIAKTAYDTIFEEGAAETPAAFQIEAQTPLVLKVIGGPNAGAEIGLEKGRTYTIGKDPDSSDIIFQDLSVSRNHARLTVTGEGILELEDLGSKNGTLINQHPVTEKRVFTTQDTISMGTTIFMVIDQEAAQETIYTPKAFLYEAPKETPEEAPALTPAEELAEEEKKDWKDYKIPGKHLIFAASFLLIFFILFMSFFSLFKSESMEVVVKAPHEHIEDALSKFRGVQYSFNPASGKLFLAGHVLTAVDYQEMKYNLTLIPAITTTEDNVVIDEYVWKMMNDVLTSNAGWKGVNIVSPAPGQFVVHGYIQSMDQFGQLAEYLNVNFPYPDRLQNQVVVEDTLNIQVQSQLQKKGFGAVTFQLSAGDLVILGRYPEKQESEYKELLSDLNKLAGIQSVKNFAVASSTSAASIDLTQQYKVSGSTLCAHQGYNAVINGRIFAVGDSLDGMKISAIEPNSILLEKDGLKYKIDYTR